MASQKFTKNKIIVITLSIFMIISTLMILPKDSKASIIDVWVFPIPEAYEMGVVRTSTWAYHGLLDTMGDGKVDYFNPLNWNYNYRVFAIAYGYNEFDIFGDSTPPPNNSIISEVKATIFSGLGGINAGWFSVGITTGINWWTGTDFLGTWVPHVYYSPSLGAGTDSGIWHNSTQFPAKTGNYQSNEWNITSLYSWNITMLMDSHLEVMWTQGQNTSSGSGSVDYLGLKYKILNYSYTPITGEYPYQDFTTNFYGLIWLLIMYLPAMAMGQFIPKLGFMAGMTLMLIVIGAIEITFVPFMILGLCILGITVYKGV